MLQCSRLFFGASKYLPEQKIERQTLFLTIFLIVTESVKLLLCKSSLIFFWKILWQVEFFRCLLCDFYAMT